MTVVLLRIFATLGEFLEKVTFEKGLGVMGGCGFFSGRGGGGRRRRFWGAGGKGGNDGRGG